MPHIAPQRVSSLVVLPVLMTALALGLAGCGRRGALEAPPAAGASANASGQQGANRLTPGVARSNARQDAASRDPLSPQNRPGDDEDEPPITPPNRPFILDAIL